MGKIKHKNNKIKHDYLGKLGKLAKKASEKGEFIEIDDSNYEIDDLIGCY